MIQSYPSLTSHEFSEACMELERRCAEHLGDEDESKEVDEGMGLRWIDVKFTGEEFKIKVVGSVRSDIEDEDNGENEGKEDTVEQEGDTEEEIEDEVDPDSLQRATTTRESVLELDFSITLSPTYSVPVLWFVSDEPRTVEDVHKLLVAPHLSDSVRDIGVMGAISRAYHPVSDLPSFFVHPCNTHEALRAVHDGESLSCEEYLVLWLGIVGSSVGLHVPSQLWTKDGEGQGGMTVRP